MSARGGDVHLSTNEQQHILFEVSAKQLVAEGRQVEHHRSSTHKDGKNVNV
jgi:hypothetical protein